MLKEHFSAGLTEAIESVFLISKSNSAFVNYRTNATLVYALGKFHNSTFGGNRLACRLRKAAGDVELRSASKKFEPTLRKESLKMSEGGDQGHRMRTNVESEVTDRTRKRFFIMKSLAAEDLASSVRDRRWITQSHNEAALKEASEV